MLYPDLESPSKLSVTASFSPDDNKYHRKGVKMANTKYGRYFKTYQAKPKEIESGRTGIARADHNVFEGCNFYWVHWNLPQNGGNSAYTSGVGHPPHIHKDAEILMLIGTNPDDPTDLGAEVVKVRYFLGLSIDETAATMDVSPRTVDNKWRAARAWLYRELSKGNSTWCGRGRLQ